MGRVLMKGNEAIAEAILRAKADAFFGYPITPQSEIPEYLAREMPKRGGLFLQPESEISVINMMWGAAATGARVVSSTSSAGFGLMHEGIPQLALSGIPCVIVDVMRGIGDILPSQEDLGIQGWGTYRVPMLLPGNVQEAANMVFEAFDIADQYFTPVLVMVDGMIGQMMEPVDFDKLPARRENLPEKTWRLAGTGEKGYRTQMVYYWGKTLTEATDDMENKKYPEIIRNEKRWEAEGVEDADIVISAYGTIARMAKYVMNKEKYKGIKIGFIRPKTYWPFPEEPYKAIGDSCKAVLVPEMCIIGELINSVRLACNGRFPVYHVGHRREAKLNSRIIEEKLDEIIAEVL